MKPTSIVLHHTAGPAGNVATIRTMHKARGFSDIGYHYVLGNGRGMEDGEIQVGRPETKNGGGVWGNNSNKLQLALVGNFHKPDPGYTGLPTAKQLRTLGEWLLSRGRKHNIPYRAIQGHKEVALPGHGTACPGSEFPLQGIRDWYLTNVSKDDPTPLDVWLGRAEPEEQSMEEVPVAIEVVGADGQIRGGVGWCWTRALALAVEGLTITDADEASCSLARGGRTLTLRGEDYRYDGGRSWIKLSALRPLGITASYGKALLLSVEID